MSMYDATREEMDAWEDRLDVLEEALFHLEAALSCLEQPFATVWRCTSSVTTWMNKEMPTNCSPAKRGEGNIKNR